MTQRKMNKPQSKVLLRASILMTTRMKTTMLRDTRTLIRHREHPMTTTQMTMMFTRTMVEMTIMNNTNRIKLITDIVSTIERPLLWHRFIDCIDFNILESSPYASRIVLY